jgi:hypothetical protein
MSEPFLKVETKREDDSSDESSSDEEKKKRFSSQQVQNKIRRNHELKGAQAREFLFRISYTIEASF